MLVRMITTNFLIRALASHLTPKRPARMKTGAFSIAIAIIIVTALMPSASAQRRESDLTELKLEELMNVEVTSVSRKEEKLFQTTAAIYVITQEDIRRSGATSIADALRLAPGLHVAQLDSNKWAISARGFNEQFANKLLVLIDGRSIYTPLFSGVYWDIHDLLLEDIERIEVIRGPGATMWGANAVNGVINIITKRAADTQGGLVVAGAGNHEQGFGGVRFGGRIGDKAHYRFYAKYNNRSDYVDLLGREAMDGWDMTRGGFRIDRAGRDSITLQGDIYEGRTGHQLNNVSLTPPYVIEPSVRAKVSGGNLLARWSRARSDRSDFELQAYYDKTRRDDDVIGETRNTFDFDFSHHIRASERHMLTWGAGYRLTAYTLTSTPNVSFDEDGRKENLFSVFVQDEMTLVKDLISLTLGSKLERNDYTGFEGQPSAHLLITPGKTQTVWASVSRAVRTPSRAHTDVRFNYQVVPGENGLPILARVLGNPDSRSEEMTAYEIGYRIQAGRRVFIDAATFYNVYHNLTTFETGAPSFEAFPLPQVVVPIRVDNKMDGKTYGGEIAASYTATRFWTLKGSYSRLQTVLRHDVSSTNTNSLFASTSSPVNQFQAQSALSLPRNLEMDATLYRTGRILRGVVPGFTKLDAMLSWRPSENLTLSLAGKNLLDSRHLEFLTGIDHRRLSQPQPELESAHTPVLVKRSIFGKVTWRF